MLRTEGRQDWRTPKWLFDRLNDDYGPFTLDVAASHDNALCAKYFTKEDDALTKVWPSTWFCNPPFAKIEPWVAHAKKQPASGVMLVPANIVHTTWFWQVWNESFEIVIVRPRVAFIHPETGLPKKGAMGGVALLKFGYACHWRIMLKQYLP